METQEYKNLKETQLDLLLLLTNTNDESTQELIRKQLRLNVEKMMNIINDQTEHLSS